MTHLLSEDVTEAVLTMRKYGPVEVEAIHDYAWRGRHCLAFHGAWEIVCGVLGDLAAILCDQGRGPDRVAVLRELLGCAVLQGDDVVMPGYTVCDLECSEPPVRRAGACAHATSGGGSMSTRMHLT
jgi:hypothetical protein